MKIIIKVLLILAMPTVIYAASDAYYVHAWGYGDMLYNVLDAIKTLIGSNSYQRMISIAMLIGAFVAVLSLMNAKDFSIYMVVQKIIAGILLYTFIMATPHDMIIKDHSTNQIYDIKKVPSIIGLPLMLFSNLEQGVSVAFRNSLGAAPGSLAPAGVNIPMMTGYDLLYSASSYRIQDPKLNQTISSFISSCVYPDILTGFIDIAAISEKNADFWSSIGSTAHPARMSSVYKAGVSGVDGELQSCKQSYTYINGMFTAYTDKNGTGFKQLAAATGLNAAGDIEGILGTISKQTFDYTNSGQSFLRNAIAINSFNDAYIQTAADVGIDSSALAYGVAKGTETAKMQMTLSGIMAKKYMPLTKGFMTVIMTAIIPLILLIAIATNSIKKPLGMVVGIFTALALWTVGSQLLDFFILLRTHANMDIVRDAHGAYTMVSKPIVESGAVDAINMAMNMYWTIPTLSFAVATMSGYSASQMMSGVGATATSASAGAAGEAATGSSSYGVSRTNMISANKYDAVSSLRSGTVAQLSNIKSIAGKDDSELTANTTEQQNKLAQKNTTTEKINSDVEKEVIDRRDMYASGSSAVGGDSTNIDNRNSNLAGNRVEDYNSKDTQSKNVSGSINEHKEREANIKEKIKQESFVDTKTSEKGTSSVVMDDVRTYKGGAEYQGYNAAIQQLQSGLSNISGDKQMLEAHNENLTKYLNSFNANTSNVALSEQQAIAGAAKVSAGVNAPGKIFSANLSAEISANVSRQAGTISGADLNKAYVTSITKTLETNQENGLYDNSDGTFNSKKYDEDARQMSSALIANTQTTMNNQNSIAGDGATDVILRGANKLMNDAKDKFNK